MDEGLCWIAKLPFDHGNAAAAAAGETAELPLIMCCDERAEL